MSDVLESMGERLPENMDVEKAVRERYSEASQAAEPALCCPVQYDVKYLDALPQELIERDYGCGDPSRYLAVGETVLDLGSGGGKICYIASQIVGAEGKVLGVDMNDDMLALARQHRQQIGDAIGYHNVTFYKGRIQDLALDLDRFDEHLRRQPIQSSGTWLEAEAEADRMRRDESMIQSDSVDVVVSNCVLNLVDYRHRAQMFNEIFRVLRRGGRAVISDIVSDETIPERLRQDPKLWSGCISGAFVEDEFLAAFQQAGFYGIEIVDRQEEAWATVDGIDFRSMTVRAFKGKDGPCLDHNQAVIYQGPWKQVMDDDGHILRRGTRMAVCEKTFQIYGRAPYQDQIISVPPRTPVPPEAASTFDCHRGDVRDPRDTKGSDFNLTQLNDSDCCGGENCCE